jgi:hypothetical protein
MASQNVWRSRHERWRLHTLKTVFSAISRDHDRLGSPRDPRSRSLGVKKRDIKMPEVKNALDSLECYIWPKWLIPQLRHHALRERTGNEVDLEGQQQVLRATFPGIRDSVRELLLSEWMHWRVSSMRLTTWPWVMKFIGWPGSIAS